MAILEHFLFNSDYPTDKIVFMHEGEITLTATWTPCIDYVNTHIPTQLYGEGDYKLPGSDAVYPMDGMQEGGSSTMLALASFMYNGECWVCPVAYTFESSLVGKKIKYRMWAYYGEETAKNTEIGTTANAAKPKLVMTSDENYPRFVGEGYVAQGQSYTHNLGYIPLVKTWSFIQNSPTPMPGGTTVNLDIYQQIYSAYFGTPTGYYNESIIQVSNTTISTFPTTGSGRPVGVYFRMYKL